MVYLELTSAFEHFGNELEMHLAFLSSPAHQNHHFLFAIILGRWQLD